MKKVLIVGASAWQVPMIKKAKELGFQVGVVDYNPNAVGIAHADAYFNASTNDPEGVYNAAKEFGADGITSVATDMPMRSIAYACQKLGLTGIAPDVAVRATDKAEMIRAFAEHDVPHPWYYVVENGDLSQVKDKLTYPCICKPTDNSASRGVVIIDNEAQLEAAIAYSSENGRSGTVIVEELLVGSEISVEAFAVKGQVSVLAITDKLTTGAPHFVEMGHNQPSRFTGDTKTAIEQAAAAAMKAVGIENGPAHVEMMVTTRGPVLIELGARLGGDFITTDLVPLSTGIDMLGATIRLACGEDVDIAPKKPMASAVRYMNTAHGVIRCVEGIEESMQLPGVIRTEMLKEIGETAGDITNSLDRVGYVIGQGETVEQAVAACEAGLQRVKVIVG